MKIIQMKTFKNIISQLLKDKEPYFIKITVKCSKEEYEDLSVRMMNEVKQFKTIHS